ncbi:MAG: winged helix-turn-helix domain-containing protein [Rickettsiaceae bacterium]|nr:winged helix-turn-helix domain-containing protein [Rickettsiaceae bacterium]
MSYRKKFPEGTAEQMLKLMKVEKKSRNLKRMQCIYFREQFGFKAEQIAELLGYHIQTVREIHSNFMQKGEAALFDKAMGGRLRENMAIEEEVEFLKNFDKDGDAGQILEVKEIHQALENKLQRSVPLSSTYNLLARNGWRKIVPRPSHPKSNAEKQEAFKKTLWHWSRTLDL